MKYCVILLGLCIPFLGCVDQDFDVPPTGGVDPDIEVTTSIAELKAMHTLGGYEEITEDIVISGLVISEDEAGNFFRQLIIQDSTGGIEMRIDATNLSTEYPFGRRVFVKCKGLWLGDFNNLIQLGADVVPDDEGEPELQRIPESILDTYVLKGTYNNEVVPKIKRLPELTFSDVSTYIRIEEMQFIAADTSSTFADAQNQIAVNLEVENCFQQRLIVRTSGFANFANDPVPNGKGTITGVFGVFGSDSQMLLNNRDGVDMQGERCIPGNGQIVTIQSVRDTYALGQGFANAGAISGVVTSDYTNQNVTGRNLYIQDETAGILVRFEDFHEFPIGTKLVIDVTGMELSEFNELLQVNNVPNDNAVSQGSAALPDPIETTVSEILNNAEAWESQRVYLPEVTVTSSSGQFSGEVVVTDQTGSMIMFTRSQATFANDALPTETVALTALISQFGAPQLILAQRSDLEGGSIGGNGTINESFNAIGDNNAVVLNGWTNVAVKGERLWLGKVFDNNHYAQATAFNDTAPEMESWLVTPAIDMSTAKTLEFKTAKAFWTHDGLSVWVSGDFSGDVTTATWQELSGARLAEESDNEHAFIDSGILDIPALGSSVYIAFKYVGSGPSGLTGSYRVDDVIVKEK